MSKITLKQVYLLNWYGFVDKTIPIGESLSLITGENECGKSTVLDAIKYAFTGDTDFNKATSATRIGSGRRTLASYTRCLIDPDTRKYARPAATNPVVYTYIALEYFNELYNTNFVLGVILETNSSDNVDNYWYSLENKTLKDIVFIEDKNGKKHVLTPKQFRVKNGAELLNKSNGVTKFMTMTGLKIQGEQILQYQRKLKSIMTYNPEAKIQQFIKESVLEDKKVSLNKLKEAKDSIDEITKSFSLLEKEINELEEILQSFTDYSKVCSRLTKDDIKRAYKDLLNTQKKIKTNTNRINENAFEIERLSGLLKQENADKEQKDRELRNANRQLDQVDGTKAIQDEKNKLSVLMAQSKELSEKIISLEYLTSRINEFIENNGIELASVDYAAPNVPSSEKNNSLNEFRNAVDNIRDELSKQRYQLEEKRRKVEDGISSLDEVIKACDRNLPDYSRVYAQIGLMNEINNRFKAMNIASRACFSGSFVVELKNEEWRNSIETYLGIHRYSILVEPEFFDIANEVMDKSRFKHVELVNTRLLHTKKFTVVDDSLLYQLEIKNETAKKYFAYWLGRIHAVDIEDVPDYENAISKEGKISKNMAVSFLDFKKVGSYCLGEDAVKLNRDRAIREKEQLEKDERSILEQINENERKKVSTKRISQIVNKEYDLEAPKKNAVNQNEINECNVRIQKLEDALKNNNEYLLLVERISEIEEQLKGLNEAIDSNRQKEISLNSDNRNLLDYNNELEIRERDYKAKMSEYNDKYPVEVREATEEYDAFVEGNRETGDVMIPSSRDRADREKRAYERDITNKQSVYNMDKSAEETLPVGLEHEAVYRKRKNRLQVDNFEDIKAKLTAQTKKYEGIFKNEFVLRIKANVEDAQKDIKEINRQLKKLQFSTTYQFDVKNVTGTSDYARILDYADYLEKTNRIDNGQIMIGAAAGYDEIEAEKREKEIKEIINRVTSKNNDDMLNDFADYRNYMEYEVIVNNDEITNGRLSKLAGYNSGAGTQIPYTIILSAALAIIYNTRQNSTRLMFIDEPFEKMSDKNIKIMLDFFKSQNFQVIFCAPPNKLDSIGKECDTVIPIKKINKSNMTLEQSNSVKKYEYKIVNGLLKKYDERKSKHKDTEIHRRIDLPIEKVLKNYSSYNVKIEEKEAVNAAIRNLESKGFITSSKLNFSDDYQKIYLVEENISDLEKYAAEKLDITPRSYVADKLDGIIEGYKGKSPIVDFYINEIENTIRNSPATLDALKAEDILKALAFLEENNDFLYLREASMLIYGDSKHLELYRRSQVCSIISKYLCANGEDVFDDENLLERFNVYDTDQDICIKGPVELVINDKKIDISDLTGGVSFSIKDLDRITDISVNCEKVMTVENKTPFLRMQGECCYIYLGGFATKPQIAFIKKLIANNPDKEYLHFGDIDAGGFWIHKKLCEKTCHEFALYHMNEEDLRNPSYAKCTKELSSNDVNRLMKLRTDSRYSECIDYMLQENVKLEQEIISYTLCHA